MVKNVTVIIPNLNGKNFLKACLESLVRQDIPLEVIVVDNASEDGSADYIKEKYPDFRLIENSKNLGFAAAVNQGIRASETDYIFLLNNDTEIERNCILNLVKCIETDKNIFAVSSKMIQHQNRKIDDAGDDYTLLGWTKKIGNGRSPDIYTERRDVFSACGGAALYRKKIFKEIGCFDENFFAYLEDVDIGYRARLHGYKAIYCPEAVVYHQGSGTSGSKYNKFKVKISARNNVYLPYKNMPWPQLALNFVFLLLGYFIKYIFFLKKGYGKDYMAGLKEGFKCRHDLNRIKYDKYRFSNYLKVEWLLVKGTVKFVFP